MTKPPDLFDRDVEWADLDRFVTSPARGIRVGVVYGRRRLGKSFMLRRLARRHEGLYHLALEEEPAPALQRFADQLAATRRLDPGQLRFADWNAALESVLTSPAARTTPAGGGNGVLVIDELPYLLAHAPGRQIPSALQATVDRSRDEPDAPRWRVIVCGSALGVMSDILSGGRPLRGRAELDLLLRPFDYRTTAELYGIGDPQVAFQLYAIFGGVPGYRDLLADASPQTPAELEELLLATACNPSHALFSEAAYLLREDPRITDRALYYSILSAIAGGASTMSKVGAAIGREHRGLAHPLDVLLTAGFVVKEDDLLLQRRPTLRVADAIIRLYELVIAPRLAAFEDRAAKTAWEAAEPTLHTQIYGPAFEAMAREWTARHAAEDTLGGPVGEVGTTVVNDAAGKAQHQVDVVALAEGQRRQDRNPTVRALGEAKDSNTPRTGADLNRLDRVRSLLVTRNIDAAGAKLMLFGRSGFDPDLEADARRRHDVELVDLERIRYGE